MTKKPIHSILYRPAILLLSLLLLSSGPATFARQSTPETSADSLDYERQRQKVNELLDQRTARFGQYDQSLKKRTGIFGLKTKKDMQASIDILQKIVLTDNEIFRETRKLLDYKDQLIDFKEFEKERIAGLAADYDQRINSYIQTISKLQQQQAAMKSEIDTLRTKKSVYSGGFILLLALILITGIYYSYKKWQGRG